MTLLISSAGGGVRATPRWVDVCPLAKLIPGRGVCALVGGHQVAVFRVSGDQGQDQIYALSNLDPFSRANVLSRGIVGSRGERLKVASPVYKQSFDLETGECLDDPSVSVPTFEVRVEAGVVQVASP
jgi:nitrite reductase (NADH) small subunit